MSRGLVAALAAAAIGALAAAARNPAPLLVWNASASAPVGLYRIEFRTPERGDYALITPSGTLEDLIFDRRYLPRDTPLLKHVAALGGDEVCRRGAAVFINSVHAADALAVDSAGRILPAWTGCVRLSDDEVFLLNAHPQSLDGRYVGPTPLDDIVGVAAPVFLRTEERACASRCSLSRLSNGTYPTRIGDETARETDARDVVCRREIGAFQARE